MNDDHSHGPTEEMSLEAGAAPLVHRQRPILEWEDDDGRHRSPVSESLVVGAGPTGDVRIADRAVSRLHARIELRDDEVWVRDLESKNGTYVDGVRVREARLDAGASLRLGHTILKLSGDFAEEAIALWPEPRLGDLVGQSTAMRELFHRIARIARSDASVLVRGETGTGKEQVARAIHELSPRAEQPFVIVDCAALPEALLESELFGHVKGAFTGASSDRAGAFEAAEGGTVFLDEIGELPLTMQPKLLRVLEARTVRRVGETKQRPVNVRFVAATHRDLPTLVNSGAFREDLLFRLAVIPLLVPPLRARPDDIPLLVRHFLPREEARLIDERTMDRLQAMPWIGNVRELRNFIQRCLVLGPEEALELTLASPLTSGAAAGDATVSLSSAPVPSFISLPTATSLPPIDDEAAFQLKLRDFRDQWLDRGESTYLRRLLERHHGRVSDAADAAGVHRSHLHRLIKRHGLDADDE